MICETIFAKLLFGRMAVLVPIVGIPAVIAAGYYSWTITYRGTCSLLSSQEEERSTLGTLLGTGATFVFTGAVVLHNSRNSPQPNIDRSVARPAYTTQQFLMGSRRMIGITSGVWVLSAITGALGSVLIGSLSPKSSDIYY